MSANVQITNDTIRTKLERRPLRMLLPPYCNVVIRDVRDCDGDLLGTVVEPHDGTPAGIIAAARRASNQMFIQYENASNIQSRMLATDSRGSLSWSISPNFHHLAEIGTDEAEYIWTGRNAVSRSG